ncbi:MAG: hypothetical protein KF805_09815 [Phycisphaeraceae bacterium]|nr:hypothetical protein [Phycisphaeraceae bacterium]
MNIRLAWKLAFLVTLFVASGGRAQPWVPPPCEGVFDGGIGYPGIVLGSGSVSAMVAWDPDGTGPARPLLVAAGGITMAGWTRFSSFGFGIAAWDGESWRPIGIGMKGNVTALTVFRGELYAGGQFTSESYSGAPALQGIARWDGARWRPLTGTPIAFKVTALAVFDDELIVANSSDIVIGGTNVGGAARFDGSTWRGLGTAKSPTVIACFAVHRGELFGGGYFPSVNGVAFNNVARWDGSAWQTLGGANPGVTGTVPDPNYFGPTVLAMRTYQDRLVIAGFFGSAGGTPATCIASWDGSAFHALGTGLSSDHIEALGEHGGKLTVGGTFKFIGGVKILSAFALWDGSAWESPPPSTTHPNGGSFAGVRAFETFQGSFHFAGSFSSVGAYDYAREVRNVGRISNVTGKPEPLTPLPGSWPDGFAVYNDTLYLYGVFSQVGANWNSPSLARVDGTSINLIGGAMTPAHSSLGLEDAWIARLRATAVFDGKLTFVGLFNSIDGVPARCVAAFDGTDWQAVIPSGLPDNTSLFSVANFDGTLVIGGSFSGATTVEGMANNIARWDGAQLHSMGTLPTTVWVLKVIEGTLYAGTSSDAYRWDGSQWIAMRSDANAGIKDVIDFETNAGDLYVATETSVYKWIGEQWVRQPAPNMKSFVRFDNHLYGVGSFYSSTNALNISKLDGTTWRAIGTTPDNQRPTPQTTFTCATEFHGRLYIAGFLGTKYYQGISVSSPSGIILTRYSKDTSPRFEGEPSDQCVTVGHSGLMQASLEAGAERPSAVTFQWRHDGVPISEGVGGASAGGGTVQGATSATLHIYGVQPSDAGAYDVVATSACGTQLSDSGTLKVRMISPDINADGLVDDADFALFVVQYDTMICNDPAMPDGCSADFNGDGFVDDQDFVLFVPAYNVILATGA